MTPTYRTVMLIAATILLAGCTALPAEDDWTFTDNQTAAATPQRLMDTAPPVTVEAGGSTLRPVMDYIRTPRHDYTNHAWPEQIGTLRMDAEGRVLARTTGTVERIELRLLREGGGEASPQRSQSVQDAQRVSMGGIDRGTYMGFVTVRPERITYRYRFRLRAR